MSCSSKALVNVSQDVASHKDRGHWKSQPQAHALDNGAHNIAPASRKVLSNLNSGTLTHSLSHGQIRQNAYETTLNER